jgi:DNA topoisomerase I
VMGAEVSAKDFRTWHATVLTAVGLAVSTQAPTSESARKRAVTRVVKEVAEYLGNTPAVCRSSYIDPRVIDLYDDGFTVATSLERLGADGEFGQPATHGMVEAAVLRLLRKQALASRRRKPVSPVKAKAA